MEDWQKDILIGLVDKELEAIHDNDYNRETDSYTHKDIEESVSDLNKIKALLIK